MKVPIKDVALVPVTTVEEANAGLTMDEIGDVICVKLSVSEYVRLGTNFELTVTLGDGTTVIIGVEDE